MTSLENKTKNTYCYEIYNERSKYPMLLTNKNHYDANEFISLVEEIKSDLTVKKLPASNSSVIEELVRIHNFSEIRFTMKP